MLMKLILILTFFLDLCKFFFKLVKSKNFCLTFKKKTNIITFERVANERKSSFAARFFYADNEPESVSYSYAKKED